MQFLNANWQLWFVKFCMGGYHKFPKETKKISMETGISIMGNSWPKYKAGVTLHLLSISVSFDLYFFYPKEFNNGKKFSDCLSLPFPHIYFDWKPNPTLGEYLEYEKSRTKVV